MSFDWEDYIRLANKLFNEPNKNSLEEAYNRSVISRAYYGVFCLARIKAGLEFDKNRAKIHQKVINYYKSSNKLKEKEVGQILDELRKDRNIADYEGIKYIDKERAERSILKANIVIEILKETQ